MEDISPWDYPLSARYSVEKASSKGIQCASPVLVNLSPRLKRFKKQTPFLELQESQMNYNDKSLLKEEHFERQRRRIPQEFNLDAKVLREKLNETLKNAKQTKNRVEVEEKSRTINKKESNHTNFLSTVRILPLETTSNYQYKRPSAPRITFRLPIIKTNRNSF